jgi:diguanylate cyclase (GGDEF)-like protein
VDSIFAALGELATCPAREPIEAVVVSAASAHRLPDLLRGIEALRRLEPGLVVIATAPGLPLRALDAQVDLQVSPPLHIEQVTRLLDGEPAKHTTPSQRPSPHVDIESAIPAESVARITDTVLIGALLQTPSEFRTLLLQSLAERSGQAGVRIEPGAGPTGSATVHDDGVTFGHLAGGDVSRLQAWARWTAGWLLLEQHLERLREEALCDDLTGALNRRGLKRFLTHAIEKARRDRREISVLVFDIDDFKSWNDRWGHEAGDVILRHVVQLLGSVIRDGDAVARTGGDEFVVVFADRMPPRTPGSTHPDSIDGIARRFQSQIADMKFPELGLGAPGAASISGGLATFPWDGDDPSTLIRIADERALESKRRGKNCMTFGPSAVDVSS